MEDVYKENIEEETKDWNILESEGSRGEWSEGAPELSDNYSENSSVNSHQARRLSIRNSSFLRYKSLQSFHRPAKYGN